MSAAPPDTPNTSPLARLMQIARTAADDGEDNPDPAIHRAIALHRESLLRHRLGLSGIAHDAFHPLSSCD